MIRKAEPADSDQIWEIFRRVIQTGDTYVFDPDTSRESLDQHWFASYMSTFVYEDSDSIKGTYIIKPNQIGLGSHIANCSYMVHPENAGKGIGKKMCEHSIDLALKSGYKGIQFNVVVSTNDGAIHLWKKLGFKIIGTTPNGFNHQELGLVDTYIMYRSL